MFCVRNHGADWRPGSSWTCELVVVGGAFQPVRYRDLGTRDVTGDRRTGKVTPRTMQAGTGTSDWAEIFFGHACAHGKLPARALLLCGKTCKHWKGLVLEIFPLLRVLDFPGREACITGADVLAVLELARGQNLTSINLARCRKISATDIDAILSFIATACPSVALIDMEGCGQAAQLRALAARTSALGGAESPRALFEFITALQEGTRCQLEHLRALLSQGRPPFLVLDVKPGQHALHDAARMGGAWVAGVLL